MKEHEWQASVLRSWGIRLHFHNPRVDLLRFCEIKGDCWVSARSMAWAGPNRYPVQRAAYVLFEGPLDRSERVYATCGNPRCCWGGHLRKRAKRETSEK